MGIIYAPGRPYVMAVMSSEVPDEEAGAGVIAALSAMVYNYEVGLAGGNGEARREASAGRRQIP